MDRILDRVPARFRTGWTLVGLIALVVLAVWVPDMDLPLGNSDDGRILGRFGLQARNFWEEGAAASGYGSSMAPYGAAINYAHHPPLLNFAHVTTVGIFGEGVTTLRIVGFVLGSATVGFMAALLRIRGMSWGPTLLAVAAMSATGFFFIYMRHGGGFSLTVAVLAAAAYLRERDDPPTWVLALAGLVSVLAAMQSWISMAVTAVAILWLFARRRFAAPTWWMALGGVLGVAITLGWMLNATDVAELTGQFDTRSDTAAFTFGEFVSRQWDFAGRLTPGWLRWLMLPALIAGAADRRTRVPMLITLGAAVALTFGLQQGAWVHILWNLPWLAPVTIGMAALFQRVADLVDDRASMIAGALAALVAVVTLAGIVGGQTHRTLLREPANAGALFAERDPDPDTKFVWAAPGVSTARWISYYWDLPVRNLAPERLDQVAADDVIVLNTSRVPEYIPMDAVDAALAQRGQYALIEGSRIAAHDPP